MVKLEKLIASKQFQQLKYFQEKTFFTADRKKRSIDVYGESEELVLVIENKVKARENMNGTDIGQTKDYRDYVEEHRKSGQKVICLFITPDPKQKPYDKSYTQITYQEFYDYVIAKCIEHPQLNKDGRYLLEQYANNLREPVHGSPMALVNTSLCNEIYDRYAEVLDEIFDDVEKSVNYLEDSKLSCVVYTHYQRFSNALYSAFVLYSGSPVSDAYNLYIEIARWSAPLVTATAILCALQNVWQSIRNRVHLLGKKAVALNEHYANLYLGTPENGKNRDDVKRIHKDLIGFDNLDFGEKVKDLEAIRITRNLLM